MRYLIVLSALTSLLLAGCIFDYHEERLAGPYSLVAVDTEDQLCICYRLAENNCTDRVGPTVVMAGVNERYVVAIRRPNSNERSHITGEEQFFYIDRRADGPGVNVGVSTKGPFTKTEFLSLGAQLGFPPMRAVHG